MSKNLVTVVPGPFKERLGRALCAAGFKTTQFEIQPSTQGILDELRGHSNYVWAQRSTGKSTALMLYARELMTTQHTTEVAILTPYVAIVDVMASMWYRMFPFERSPIFTTSVLELLRILPTAVLLDEPSYFSKQQLDDLERLRLVLPSRTFAGAVGS